MNVAARLTGAPPLEVQSPCLPVLRHPKRAAARARPARSDPPASFAQFGMCAAITETDGPARHSPAIARRSASHSEREKIRSESSAKPDQRFTSALMLLTLSTRTSVSADSAPSL